jgi:DNA polymerase III subunit delta
VTVAVHGYHLADASLDAVIDAIETPSLFGGATLVVVRGIESLADSVQERLARSLERQAPQVTLVVIARGADMRRKFMARCRELAERVAVDHPRPHEMRGWADRFARERRRALDDDARELLIDCVGRDLLVLATELDKLTAAVPESRPIAIDDVRRVTAAGREHGNFEVVDAVTAGDPRAAVRALGLALDEGAPAIALVGALAATLRTIMAGADLVARGKTVDEAVRALPMAPYQRRNVEHALRRFGARTVRRALLQLADIDVAAKTGIGDPRALLEDWVLWLCRARRQTRAAA